MSVKTQQKRGGGLGAYNKEEFSFTVREDLNQIDTTIEQLWLKGKNKNSSILIGTVITQLQNRAVK